MVYTAGELAKKLGVSARTVRFYDEKNLLPPQDHSGVGYRLYNEESAERLQKILMLRFMDFSLEQISVMMQEEQFNVKNSLREQEQLLIQKKEHIERILTAVRETLDLLERKYVQPGSEDAVDAPETKQLFWKNMNRIIEMTQNREYVAEQYRKDDNLNKRISIHDYSTASIAFYPWMLGRIALAPDMKVLDIGCGNAAFWKGTADALPCGLEIHLVDCSDGMLASAEKNVKEIQKQFPEKNLRFILDHRDAAKFSYPVSEFDRIMANHMLYHLNRETRMDFYPKINALLAADGRFSCSLIGRTHLLELHQFLKEYYPEIGIPSDSFDLWFENAAQELEGYFTVLDAEEQKNDLLVPEEELVFQYVSSYSAQAKEILARNREIFLERVRSKMDGNGHFYIHKSTGIVICSKKTPLSGAF